jgi:cobalt/nickel transport system ATP-binding protein
VAGGVDDAVLAAEGLAYSYDGGAAALDGLDLTIARGLRLALVGANGAGKTTLLLHLNGTLRPRAGSVWVKGRRADYSRRDLTRWRQTVGLVFQNPDDQLFAGTVAQDVSFGPMNLDIPVPEVRDRVDDALESLDIVELRDRPTHMLSFGQKKRVAIAGAVAMRPEVLIIDEPLSGLDPSGAEHLLAVLQRLARGGTTLVLATHDMALAYAWADEVAVLRRGAVAAHGDPAEVMSDDALLRSSGLRMPWVLEVERRLQAAGVLAAGGAPRRSRRDLVAALEGLASAPDRAPAQSGA